MVRGVGEVSEPRHHCFGYLLLVEKKKKKIRKGTFTTTQMPVLHLQSMLVALCVLSCSCLNCSKGILENLQVELNQSHCVIYHPIFPLGPSEFSREPFLSFPVLECPFLFSSGRQADWLRD